MTADATRAQLAERLEAWALDNDAAAAYYAERGDPDGEPRHKVRAEECREVAAALREPRLRCEWEEIDFGLGCFVGDLYVGRVENHGSRGWYWYPSTHAAYDSCDTEAEAKAALEAHVAAQLGGTPAPDLDPLVRQLVGALNSLGMAYVEAVGPTANLDDPNVIRTANALAAAKAVGIEPDGGDHD